MIETRGSTSHRGASRAAQPIAERGASASITIDVFRVGKPRTVMSPFERRGMNANATRCQ